MAEAVISARIARDLLGVDSLATADDVHRAFRAVAKALHPDHGGSAERFRELVAAYRRLEGAPRPAKPAPRAQSWIRDGELWLTVRVPSRTLAEGGRLTVETPTGRRTVWITRMAAQAGLIRLEGLVLRLTPDDAVAETPARGRLRQFAAAWAV